MKIKQVIKQLFCKHEYIVLANIDEELQGYFKGCATILGCRKCGKRKYIKEYVPAPFKYSDVLRYGNIIASGSEEDRKSMMQEISATVEKYAKQFDEEVNNESN